MTDTKTSGLIAFEAFHRVLFGRTSQRWMMITEQAREAWEAAAEAAITAASQQPAPTAMCKIYGSEVEFEMDVPEENLVRTCQYIWDNPQEFSDFKANSEGAYYGFLKFLWGRRPDGTEYRLDDIVEL